MVSWLFCFMTFNPFRVLYAKLNFKQLVDYKYSFCLQTLKYQNSSISNSSLRHKYTVSMSKKVLFQATQFSSI